MGETAPFWRFSAASYPDLERTMSDDEVAVKPKHSANGAASIASQVYILLRCPLWKETLNMSYLLRRFLFCYFLLMHA